MCGIAGWYSRSGNPIDNKIAEELVDELFYGISSRGRDACGFVAIGAEGTLQWQKAAVPTHMFKQYRRPVPEGTTVCLLHTRWSTQGHEGFMENNHPVKRGRFYVVHNGHVHNDDDIFKTAERDRYGQVDSEAIVALMSHYGSLESSPLVMGEIEGDAACAFVDETHHNQLVLARGNSSPLHILEDEDLVVFASTEAAVKDAYGRVFDLTIPEKDKLNIRPFAEGTSAHWTDGKMETTGFEPKKWERATWSAWKPGGKNTSGGWGGSTGYGFGASRSDAGEACSVPDDGRPEPAKKTGMGPAPGGMFVCELCEEDTGRARNKFDDEGVTWFLCDDCFRWAQDTITPGTIAAVSLLLRDDDDDDIDDYAFLRDVRDSLWDDVDASAAAELEEDNGSRKKKRRQRRRARRS